jgi:hypothetical protein
MNEEVAARPHPPETPKATSDCDPLYLFACHLEWEREGNLRAVQQLIAALDDLDEEARLVAESLLHRPSPHRLRSCVNAVYFDW